MSRQQQAEAATDTARKHWGHRRYDMEGPTSADAWLIADMLAVIATELAALIDTLNEKETP